MRVPGYQRKSYAWRWAAALAGLAVLSFALVMAVVVTPTEQVHAANLVVDNVGDVAAQPCTGAANDCSLRSAIQAANGTAAADTITFNIPAASCPGGVCTIPLGSSLPALNAAAAITITGPTSVRVLVTGAGAGNPCFILTTGGNTIQGLVISGCGNGTGIAIQIQAGSTGNFIRNNRIGTSADGLNPIANGSGIVIAATADGNWIGGASANQGNVISGNAGVGLLIASNTNTVAGNLIGTSVAGTGAVPNGAGVALLGSGNTVGGTTAGSRNIISGNVLDGVLIVGPSPGGSSNTVEGNCIGVQIDCATPRPNGGMGVDIAGGAIGNTVGGTANVIAQNVGAGVAVAGAGTWHNKISRNQMSVNDTCGIDLAGGNNDLVPAAMLVGPTISGITFGGGTTYTVAGGAASAIPGATIEIFVSSSDPGPSSCTALITAPTGQGSCFIGSTTADGSGAWSVNVASIGGLSITATQTNAANSTSEFSTVKGAPAGPSGATCGLPLPVATPTPVNTNTPVNTAVPAATNTPAPTATSIYALTATPTTGPMQSVALVAGCNPESNTYADATPIATLGAAVSPSGILVSIWKFDPATNTWLGYAPDVPADVNNLASANRLDAIFICVSATGTWSRPVI